MMQIWNIEQNFVIYKQNIDKPLSIDVSKTQYYEFTIKLPIAKAAVALYVITALFNFATCEFDITENHINSMFFW